MRPSTSFQNKIIAKLREYFPEVEKEWDVTKNATDLFSIRDDVYAPRIDVAVGPFNTEEGNRVEEIRSVFSQKASHGLKNRTGRLRENRNPRCTLAIEVVYSGSSKHILGDITNASMMGLYGFVIANSSNFDRLKRIFEYTKVIKHVGKAPEDLFSNVCVISDKEFLRLL